MSTRRNFLKAGLAGTALSFLPGGVKAIGDYDFKKLTILHTNDIHSRIEPFDENHPRYSNKGGLARIAAEVEKIRQEEENVLLLDAGDIFQGTPYFNMFGGELELDLMSNMGYSATTIGNHEFDMGIDHLAEMMQKANFPYLNVNYDFTGTPINGLTQDYKVLELNGLKIGLFGIGIKLHGLVSPKLYSHIQYSDPLAKALKISRYLKHSLQCDLVVCLSHLGFSYETGQISDVILAKKSKNIDLIIGGHTHTFLKQPLNFKNAINHTTTVTQAGWAGLQLGKIDYLFCNKKKFSILNRNTNF